MLSVVLEMMRDALLAPCLGRKVPQKRKFLVKWLRNPTTRGAWPHRSQAPLVVKFLKHFTPNIDIWVLFDPPKAWKFTPGQPKEFGWTKAHIPIFCGTVPLKTNLGSLGRWYPPNSELSPKKRCLPLPLLMLLSWMIKILNLKEGKWILKTVPGTLLFSK